MKKENKDSRKKMEGGVKIVLLPFISRDCHSSSFPDRATWSFPHDCFFSHSPTVHPPELCLVPQGSGVATVLHTSFSCNICSGGDRLLTSAITRAQVKLIFSLAVGDRKWCRQSRLLIAVCYLLTSLMSLGCFVMTVMFTISRHFRFLVFLSLVYHHHH